MGTRDFARLIPQDLTTGPLLILLHGLGGSSVTFTSLLPHLPLHQYRVLSVDLEGFGLTQLSDCKVQLSIDRYVADLESLVAHMESDDSTQAAKHSVVEVPVVNIIGHSLGSIIALHYASRHADKVKGLGLLGVGRSASHVPAARERMLGLAAKVRNEGIEKAAELATQMNVPSGDEGSYAREQVFRAVMTSDAEGYAKTCEAMASPDHRDPDYSAISCPAVFVVGEHDIISPLSRAKRWRHSSVVVPPSAWSREVISRS
ncbi:hypothetical protein LTR53_002800 [Teratosphaeriaceae sp. CCFEE 6253]|nr:hypothetical protein LTR53_002800 [Teratosphaeriaceae sp. CCFEE 6253]